MTQLNYPPENLGRFSMSQPINTSCKRIDTIIAMVDQMFHHRSNLLGMFRVETVAV